MSGTNYTTGPQPKLNQCIADFEKLSDDYNKKAQREFWAIIAYVIFGLIALVTSPYVFKYLEAKYLNTNEVSEKIEILEDQIKANNQEVEEIKANLPQQLWESSANNVDISNEYSTYNDAFINSGSTLDFLFNPVHSTKNGVKILTGNNGLFYININNTDTTWAKANILTQPNEDLSRIIETPQGVLITTSSQGNIYTSTNGQNWTKHQTNDLGSFSMPQVSPSGIGIITSSSGQIYTSTDNGQTWQQQNLFQQQAIKPALFAPQFFANDLALIGGTNNTLLISQDNGANWNKVDIKTDDQANNINENIKTTFYVNGTLIALGHYGNIYYSTDQNLNWTIEKSEAQANGTTVTGRLSPTNVITIIETDGYNTPSQIKYSIGDSQQWQTQTIEENVLLYPPIYNANGLGLITTDNDYIYIFNTQRNTWDKVVLPAQFQITGKIITPYNNKIILTTASGIALSTTNSGQRWEQKSLSRYSLNGPYISPDNKQLVITADNGKVFMSTDNGLSWQEQQLNNRQKLSEPAFSANSVSFATNKEVFYSVDTSKLTTISDKNELVSKLKETALEIKAIQLEQLLEETKLRTDLLKEYNALDDRTISDNTERTIIRISALALLIFLIQISVTKQRYNIKLANFYRSRAQALTIAKELSRGNEFNIELSVLISLMTPTTEFGSETNLPAEQVVALSNKLKPVQTSNN